MIDQADVEGTAMAVDTFLVHVGVYPGVDAAEADYEQFPFAAIGGGFQAGTAGGGALLGAVAGNAAAGMCHQAEIERNAKAAQAHLELHHSLP